MIGATTEWLAGVDNSDSDSFKINAITGGSDFTGTGITLTTAGNLGVGVTPSAWTSGRNAIQLFGSSTAVYFAGATTNTIFSNNTYYNAGDKFTTASGYAQQYQQQSNGVHAWFTSTAASGGAGATATMTQAMTLDASGNLLVGTTSSATGNTSTFQSRSSTNADFGLAVTNTSTDGNVRSLLVSSPNSSSDDGYLIIGSRSTGDRFFVRTSGNVQNTNNSYGAISDVKLKENIVDATPKLEKLNQVRIVNYNLIGESHKQIGVIAQELEAVFPAMVEESLDRDAEGNDLGTTTKSVKYSVFVPMLIKAIQEQQALITQLTARITALEGA